MSSKEMHRLCKIHSVEKIDMLGQLKAIKKKIEQGKHWQDTISVFQVGYRA